MFNIRTCDACSGQPGSLNDKDVFLCFMFITCRLSAAYYGVTVEIHRNNKIYCGISNFIYIVYIIILLIILPHQNLQVWNKLQIISCNYELCEMFIASLE